MRRVALARTWFVYKLFQKSNCSLCGCIRLEIWIRCTHADRKALSHTTLCIAAPCIHASMQTAVYCWVKIGIGHIELHAYGHWSGRLSSSRNVYTAVAHWTWNYLYESFYNPRRDSFGLVATLNSSTMFAVGMAHDRHALSVAWDNNQSMQLGSMFVLGACSGVWTSVTNNSITHIKKRRGEAMIRSHLIWSVCVGALDPLY